MRSKIKISILLILLSYVILMLCSSCKDENNNNFTSSIVFSDTGQVHFALVENLFTQTCVASQCHGGSSPVDGLDLSYPSWEKIVNFPGLVIPKNSSSSLLYWRIAGIHGYTRMPPQNYPALTTNQINGIKRWIDQGALPN